MSHSGHLQNSTAPVVPAGNATTTTTTTTRATTNAQAYHCPAPENLARIRNPQNLAAYLSRDDVTEMRALGKISADDERGRFRIVEMYLEAWEQNWQQMGREAALAPAPAPAPAAAAAAGGK